ncbi:MAG TPA: SdpI family protein [Chitinophagaceae bacterium]|nr:SdpI family protein [Chitinophagaceae bacterium]
MNKLIKTVIWLIWAAPAVYLAAVWDKVPERVALKYNLSGEPIRFGSKTELLLVLAVMLLVNIGVYFLLVNIHRIDPKKKYREENLSRMRKLAVAVSIFVSAITCFVIYSSSNPGTKFNSKIIVVFLGLLFTVVGNYLYNIRPNYFAGIRLPWTLENEENWRLTHMLAGKLWFAGGLLIAVTGFLLPDNIVLVCTLAVIIILTVIPTVYSYRLYKKNQGS